MISPTRAGVVHLGLALCAISACVPSGDEAHKRGSAPAPVTLAPVQATIPPAVAPDSQPQLAASDYGVVVDPSITQPRVDRSSGRHVLHLPVAMDSALRVLLPAFRATPYDAFDRSMAAWVWESNPDASLFAVVADFDGDGRADVAIQGNAGIVVVLNLAAGPRAECPRTCGAMIDAPTSGSVYSYIEVQKRGVVTLFSEDGDDASLKLPHDGFQDVYFEKGSQVFYYEGGKWKSATTSD